ncbi:hypothetical protein [Mycobacterium tilburgii]|nr:hypothetical protein [Mycobacterium tilburgii]
MCWPRSTPTRRPRLHLSDPQTATVKHLRTFVRRLGSEVISHSG